VANLQILAETLAVPDTVLVLSDFCPDIFLRRSYDPSAAEKKGRSRSWLQSCRQHTGCPVYTASWDHESTWDPPLSPLAFTRSHSRGEGSAVLPNGVPLPHPALYSEGLNLLKGLLRVRPHRVTDLALFTQNILWQIK